MNSKASRDTDRLLGRAGLARRGAADAAAPAPLETLEPRVLLSTYVYTPVVEAFDLERFVREIAAPDSVAPAQRFGARVTGVGDVDGDGADDLAVSAPGFREPGLDSVWQGDAGAVFVYSGRTLEMIRSLGDGFAGFGSALANLGDVDGDGVSDLAVASPNFSDDAAPAMAGRVWVYSGADGSVLRELTGAAEGEQLGFSMARVGDVDADGVTDLFVGAPGGGEGGAGAAYVYSVGAGMVLRAFVGEQPGERFGHSVAGGVDLPRLEGEEFDDMVGEFIVGAPANDAAGTDAGRAYVFDGASGDMRIILTGESAGDRFASAVFVHDGGEINRAFNMRIVIGSPGYDLDPFEGETLVDAGRVQRFGPLGFADANGPLFSDEAGARLGSEIFAVGEVAPSYTEVEEYAVTAPGAADPADRLRLFALHGAQPLGETPAAGAAWAERMGDADADGILDLAAGFPDGEEPVVRLIPLTLVTALTSITAASENGRFFVLQSSFVPADSSIAGYLVRDGGLTPLPGLPGLGPRDGLIAVNDAGLFFGAVTPPTGEFPPSTIDTYFFYFNGERTALSDAITRIDGPAPTTLSFVRLGDGGDAVFTGSGPGGSGAYLFRGGVLTFLWEGVAADVNASGMVVGTTRLTHIGFPSTGVVGAAIARSPDGTVFEIPGLVNATAVNDLGEVAGATPERDLAVWDGSAVRIAAPLPSITPPAVDFDWDVRHLRDDGRMLATLRYVVPTGGRPPSSANLLEYIFTPERGLEEAKAVVAGEPDTVFFINAFLITDAGVLVLPSALALPPFGPIDGTAAAGFPRSAAADGGGLVVTAINQSGVPIVLRGASASWAGQALPVDGGSEPFFDVLTYTDPDDGRSYAVVRDGNPLRLLWFKADTDGVYVQLDPMQMPPGAPGIVGGLTHFTGPDNRAVILARDAAGDVIAMMRSAQPGAGGEFTWEYVNLSDDLRGQGLATPAFVGGFTAFTTRWDAMHIVGLDEAGDAQVIWWAPGMALWSVENLSENAGTPTLSGRLVSYVTTWDALTIVGTEAGSGDLVATWWVPMFGPDWAVNDLTLDSGTDLKLDADSITAYVTDWGGLNIAGIDAETGEAAVYWWTPATNVWTVERFTVAPPTTGEDALRPVGRLTSAAQGQTLSVFGRTEEGEIVRMFWNVGDGGVWSIQNLTALVG